MLQFLLTQIGKLKAAISSISSKTDSVSSLTVTFDSELDLNASSKIYAYKYMNLLFVTGFMNSNASVPANKTIAKVDGVNVLQEMFISVNGGNGGLARFKLTNATDKTAVFSEAAMTSYQWYSFSFCALLKEGD